MPTSDGFLTDPEIALVSNWVRDHWESSRGCPMCGQSRWSIGDSVLTIESPPRPWGITVTATGALPPPRFYQSFVFVSLTCGHCAFTTFINAYAISGLMKELDSKEVSDG